MIELEKPNPEALVVRANKLIESRHRLSKIERRFLFWIISEIRVDDEDFKSYVIGVSEWVEFSGLSNKAGKHHYRELKTMANKLTQKNTFIESEDGDFQSFSWFLRIGYKKNIGTIEACLNPELKKYLLQLKCQFTKITLKYALLLNSSYASQIYDLLKQYEKIGERLFDIDDLRYKLELENKYKLFADFRRNILEISQREINNKTDISFDWQAIKTGRKVTAIRFIIKKNVPVVTLDSPEYKDPKAARLLTRLHTRHGVAEQTARNLINDFDCDRIDWHIKEYEAQLKAGKNLKAGWLIEAIKTDHRPQQGLFLEEEQAKQDKRAQAYKQQQAAAAELEKLEDLRVTIQNKANATGQKIACELADKASPRQQDIYRREFLQDLQKKDSFTVGDFEKKGWQSLLNRPDIIAFFSELYPDSFPPMSDFTKPYGFEGLEDLEAKISTLEKAAEGKK